MRHSDPVPMSSYPELHELIWLFESEPELLDEDLGWPISRATFRTSRGEGEVRCSIEVYDRTVELDCFLAGDPTMHLKIRQEVDSIAVDRSHDAETLLIRPQAGSQLGDVRLRLKPQVRLFAETVLPWER